MHVGGNSPQAPVVKRTVFVPLDNDGASALAEFDAISDLLPDPIKLGLEYCRIDGSTFPSLPDVSRSLARVRQKSFGDRIEKAGGRLEGDGLLTRVHVIFVGALETARARCDAIADILAGTKPPGQVVIQSTNIILCCTPDAGSGIRVCQARLDSSSNIYLENQLANGESIGKEDVFSVAAGAIFLLLLSNKIIPSGLEGAGTPWTVGFAAVHGVVGCSRGRLAALCAQRLIKKYVNLNSNHDNEPDSSAENQLRRTSPALKQAIEYHDIFSLVLELFQQHGHEQQQLEIPAAGVWREGRELAVDLGTSPALELHLSDMSDWPERLREYSRAFDMTKAAMWNSQMNLTAAFLADRNRDEILSTVHEHIKSTVSGLSNIGRYIHALRESAAKFMKAGYRKTAEMSFDHELSRLAELIDSRPSLPGMTLSLALWLIPTLAVLIFALMKVFSFPFDLFLSVVSGCAISSGAVYWIWNKYNQHHRKIMKSRDKCIEVVERRLESILAENAYGYGSDMLVDCRALYDEIEEFLEQTLNMLKRAAQDLDAIIEPESGHFGFLQPALSTRSEYERLYSTIGLKEEEYLRKAFLNFKDGLVPLASDDSNQLPGKDDYERFAEGIKTELCEWMDKELEFLDIPGLAEVMRDIATPTSSDLLTRLEEILDNAEYLSSQQIVECRAAAMIPHDLEGYLEQLRLERPELQQFTEISLRNFPLACFLRIARIEL